jgi:hypothetical protein
VLPTLRTESQQCGLTIGSSDRGALSSLSQERVDDLDKSVSIVVGASPRRSTSSLAAVQMVSTSLAKWIHNFATTLIAVGLVIVGAQLADRFQLPFIHGWALAHGAIFMVFPLYWLTAYFALLPLRRRLESPHPNERSSPRLSLLAASSVVLAGSGFVVPMAGSVLGIIVGHIARFRISRRSDLTGSGMALVGLVVGYIGLAYSIYVYWMVSSAARRLGS